MIDMRFKSFRSLMETDANASYNLASRIARKITIFKRKEIESINKTTLRERAPNFPKFPKYLTLISKMKEYEVLAEVDAMLLECTVVSLKLDEDYISQLTTDQDQMTFIYEHVVGFFYKN